MRGRAALMAVGIRDARHRLDNFLEAAQATSENELHQKREATQQRLREIDAELVSARQGEATAQQTVDEARVTATKLTELAAAENAFATVEGQQAVIAISREKVAAARKAEQLLDLERSVRERLGDQVQAEATSAERQRERAIAEQAELVAHERFVAEEQRREERAEADRETQYLRGLRDRVEKIALAATELENSQRQFEQETAEGSRLESEVRNLDQKIAEREEQLTALRTSAQRTDFLSITVQRLDTLLRDRRALDHIHSDLATAHSRYDEADSTFQLTKKALQAARLRLDQLQGHWISAQAAILASNLSSGCPCPVCGSKEHPAPANSDVPLPNELDLKQLRSEVNALEAQQESHRQEVSHAKNDITRLGTAANSLVSQLGESAESEVADLEGQLKPVQLDLSSARRAGEEANLLAEVQIPDRGILVDSSTQLDKAKSRQQESSNRLAAARQAVAERQDGVPESLRTLESIDAAIRRAAAQLKAMTDAYEAARSVAEETRLKAARSVTAQESAAANANNARERTQEVLYGSPFRTWLRRFG